MKWKIKFVTIVVLIFLIGNFASAMKINFEGTVQKLNNGNTLYVGGIGPGNYTLIQDAINDASKGDTIFVFSGNYYERNISVSKELYIIGEEKNNTIVDCQYDGYPFNIYSPNVYLSGFKLLNSGSAPLWDLPGVIVNSNNIIIENNIISNMKGSGVSVWDGRYNNIIEKNVITKCAYGVTLRYESFDNIVYDNSLSDNKYGILFNSGDVTAYCNKIYDNEYGMYLTHTSNSNIHNNHIFNNERGIIVGPNCFDNTISENIVNNNNVGIQIEKQKNHIVIQTNSIQGNTKGVLLSDGCENAEISRNEISNNDLGILITWNSNNNIISQNNFIGNNKNADFELFSFKNNWNKNYWDKPRILPYIIRGKLGIFFIPWINFDWNPGKEPYDII